MAQNLFEAYKGRIAVAEKMYAKAHNGDKLNESKKLVLAKCLKNVNGFLNEAMEQSVATQRSDLGLFKKFAMNLTTVALPNLISHDLVIVQPLSSMSGYINYIQYVAGNTKGQTTAGDVFNDPFRLGNVDVNFTGSHVVETVPEGGTITLAWTPIVKGAFGEKTVDQFGNLTVADPKDYKVIHADGSVTYGTLSEGATSITGLTAGDKVAYVYNNVVVPQANIPMLKAQMKALPLIAKARRIAIYYSQIAAFQAKQDYGFDLAEQLAEKAVGQLSYEIDTEVVTLLDTTAGAANTELSWNREVPYGVSKAEHYEAFTEIVAIGRQLIYDRTKRFAPNYMIIASNILPVLGFAKGWKAAPTGNINGPYFAGTLDGLKVFVSPTMKAGRFVIGVNGDDMMSSVAVYAPYMPIVPTQLLQYADGGTSQGWSTMYALEVLNRDLIVAGEVTKTDYVVKTATAN